MIIEKDLRGSVAVPPDAAPGRFTTVERISTEQVQESLRSEQPMTEKQHRIYVVDSDPLTDKLVAQATRTKKVICQNFSTAGELLDEIQGDTRGCIVSEIHLEGLSGLKLLKEIGRRRYHLPTILLSEKPDTAAVVAAMRQGAVTVLDKPCRSMELSAAIRLALRLEKTGHQERTRLAAARKRFATLTTKERKILNLVTNGVPNRRIARELDIGLRTVEGRRRAVFEKLKADSLAQLVRLAVLLENSSD